MLKVMEQAVSFFSQLLSPEGFPPRWLCGHWTGFHGWLYILSDLGIWAAYFAIPALLLYFVRQRKDLPFHRIFWLFAAFIFACGTTHLLDAIMFWWPAYRLSGLLYFATAVISWWTIFALVPIIPSALSLKSPVTLEKMLAERTAALRDSEQSLTAIFNQTSVGIALTDLSGRFMRVNGRYGELVHRSEAELLATTLQDITHPDDLKAHHQAFSPALHDGTGFVLENRYQLPDGASIWVNNNVSILHDDAGQAQYAVSVIQDVSERKAVGIALAMAKEEADAAKETAEIANLRKSQFLATMSHELRTPLNAIIGYSEMIMKGYAQAPEKQMKYASNIAFSGRHLLDIVNDILDISSIEFGRVTCNLEPLEIRPFIRHLESMMSMLTEEKSIRLTFDVDPSLTTVPADITRLRQILLNLINNGIKFNRAGGAVMVTVAPTADNQWIEFEVRDTGIGIPQTELPNLFTEFHQVDNSLSRLYEGTGLGLALTRKLVELHHGTITVHSEENVGSRFVFRLPNVLSRVESA